MKKRVLFILQQYKPFSSPTCICFENVIDEMMKNHEAFVLTNDYAFKNSKDSDNVFRVRPFLSTRLENSKKKNRFICNAIFILESVFRLLLFFSYPRQHKLYLRRFEKTADKICKEYNIDIVIPVCFSVDNLYAGLYAKKMNEKVCLCPYIIDGFSSGKIEKFFPKKYGLNKRLKFEKELFNKSEHIFAMKTMRAHYESFFKEFQSNFHFIDPPFYKTRNLSNFKSSFSNLFEKDEITFVYTGYLYLPDRDPLVLKNVFECIANKVMKKMHL
ncbi:MAG: hypothetical protein K6E21_00275, partial [Bacilli bacterium]|nr:hypothetical protein [Bacilli bacterium]